LLLCCFSALLQLWLAEVSGAADCIISRLLLLPAAGCRLTPSPVPNSASCSCFAPDAFSLPGSRSSPRLFRRLRSAGRLTCPIAGPLHQCLHQCSARCEGQQSWTEPWLTAILMRHIAEESICFEHELYSILCDRTSPSACMQ